MSRLICETTTPKGVVSSQRRFVGSANQAAFLFLLIRLSGKGVLDELFAFAKQLAHIEN